MFLDRKEYVGAEKCGSMLEKRKKSRNIDLRLLPEFFSVRVFGPKRIPWAMNHRFITNNVQYPTPPLYEDLHAQFHMLEVTSDAQQLRNVTGKSRM